MIFESMAPKYLKGLISSEVPGGTNLYYNLSLTIAIKFLVKTSFGIDCFGFFLNSRMVQSVIFTIKQYFIFIITLS